MKIIPKDILTVDPGIIVQQVNCQGKMGSGLAKSIRNEWTCVFEEYKRFCSLLRPEALLGQVQRVPVFDHIHVFNLFGQLNYGRDGKRYTSYAAWERALPQLAFQIKHYKLSKFPVYFPYKIGCDLGGGDWRIISAMIEEYFPNATICRLPKEFVNEIE